MVEWNVQEDSAWRVKFSRAQELRQELSQSLEKFMAAENAEIKIRSTGTKKYVTSIHYKREIPKRISAIFGDIIHNYRSAVESGLYSLVAYYSEDKDFSTDKIKFPIYKSKDNFNTGNWHSKVLPNEVTKFIETLQPFSWINLELSQEENRKLLNGHHFSRLQEISNTDKHKSIKLMFVNLGMFAIFPLEGGVVSSRFISKPPWQDGADIFEFELEIDCMVNVQPEFRIVIEGEEEEYEASSIDNLLDTFDSQIHYILTTFEYFMTKSGSEKNTILD